MLDELRDRMAVYLSEHRVCILSTAGSEGAWAMPVHYRSLGLEIDCLLPRWADVVYHDYRSPGLCVSGDLWPGAAWSDGDDCGSAPGSGHLLSGGCWKFAGWRHEVLYPLSFF